MKCIMRMDLSVRKLIAYALRVSLLVVAVCVSGCGTTAIHDPNAHLDTRTEKPLSVQQSVQIIQKMSYYGSALVTDANYKNAYGGPRCLGPDQFMTLSFDFKWTDVMRIALVSYHAGKKDLKPFRYKVYARLPGPVIFSRGSLLEKSYPDADWVLTLASFGEIPEGVRWPYTSQFERERTMTNEQPIGNLPEFLTALRTVLGRRWNAVTTEAMSAKPDSEEQKRLFPQLTPSQP